MSHTMNDVVTRALRRLRVINPRKTVDGTAASTALDALNEMMHSWKGLGIDIDHETADLTDDFPLDEEHVQGVAALLAVRLADDYGVQVPAGVARDADQGWTAIQAEFADEAPPAEFESGLINMGLGRYW